MRVGRTGRGWVRRLAVLVVLGLLATACVSAGEQGGNSTASGEEVKPKVAKDPSEPVTITFQSWVTESPLFKKLKQEFEADHPNITVEYQLVPSGRARDKLLTQVAGGNAPDVAYMDMGSVEDFASRGALYNIAPYVAGSDIISMDDYVDALRSAVEIDNGVYALPYSGETTGLFYRTDMFQEAGIDGPPQTWDELQADAAKLTELGERTLPGDALAVIAERAGFAEDYDRLR